MDSAIASDDQGRFQFDGVSPGTYFVLYDSGVGDFDDRLRHWGGQTIKLGNAEWLADEYYVPDAEGNCSIHLPSGTPLMGFNIEAYVAMALLFCDSPFILAHDVEKTFSNKALELVVVDVAEGQTSQVKFQAMYFSPTATPTPVPPTATPTSDPTKGIIQVSIKNPSDVNPETQMLALWPIEEGLLGIDLSTSLIADIGDNGQAVFRDVPPAEYALVVVTKDWMTKAGEGALPLPGKDYVQLGDDPQVNIAKPVKVTSVAGETVIIEGYSYLRGSE